MREASIIMPCYHNYEITKEAVESVLNFTDDVDFELILINDGADRQLHKYFKRLVKYNDNIAMITNKKNVGWVKAVNQGIEISNGENVLFLNNDIEVPYQMSGWLRRMVDCKADGVGTTSNFVMGYQHSHFNKHFPIEHFTKFLIGFCMLVTREVIDDIGLLDEKFGIGGNDDLDYSIRMVDAGYKLKIVRDIFIHHKGTMSLPLVFDNLNDEEQRTRDILIDKWGKERVDELFSISDREIKVG